ncbi:hypothetical protein CHCC20375_0998 [Bacillus licheniformis]|nr:hypothetical protein CHCC20375_0998 [Bacillus licheniformis]
MATGKFHGEMTPIVPVEKEHCRQLENILKNAMARYPKTTAAL